jgi:hypothetical protein
LRRLPTIVTMLYGAAMGRSSAETKPVSLPSRTCKKMQVHEIGQGLKMPRTSGSGHSTEMEFRDARSE